MKSWRLLLCLLLTMASFNLHSSDKVEIAITNLEDLAGRIKDIWAGELSKPIQIPPSTIKECEKIELQCQIQETMLRLSKDASDLNFKIEAMTGQTFIYSLDLPKAIGETNLIIRGKVMGKVFDLKFKIEASSISTSKEKALSDSGPDIDWLKGSGKLFLELKNNQFVASSINFPKWKIDNLKIIPTDRLAQIFMTTFGRFGDLEKLALGILNSQIQNYLQDANLHLTFANALNNLFAKIPELLSPLKNYGINATLIPTSLSTSDRKTEISLTPQLLPTEEAHSCALGLKPNQKGVSLSSMLYKNIHKAGSENEIEVDWPLSLFENVIYLMAKYPLLDRQGKPTPPLLCQTGKNEIHILGKKQTFNYNFVPVKNITLKINDKHEPTEMVLNLWAELKGESDQYPKLVLVRKENGQKINSLLINLDVILGLSLTEKGLFFEFKTLNFKQVLGAAKLKWPLHLLSLPVPMAKIRSDLEKAILTYIETNITKFILLSPEINVSSGHSIRLQDVILSEKNITSKLKLK